MNLEDLADQDQAVTVPCPLDLCAAAIGDVCRSLSTGQPLRFLPAHDARLRAAGVRHAPLDSRDLRAAHERTPRS